MDTRGIDCYSAEMKEFVLTCGAAQTGRKDFLFYISLWNIKESRKGKIYFLCFMYFHNNIKTVKILCVWWLYTVMHEVTARPLSLWLFWNAELIRNICTKCKVKADGKINKYLWVFGDKPVNKHWETGRILTLREKMKGIFRPYDMNFADHLRL